MRLVVVAFALVLSGCTDSYGEVSIDPTGGPPLGVGLTQRYKVDQVLCEGGVDGDCSNSVFPTSLDVSLLGDNVVSITNVHGFDGSSSGFDLTGTSDGSTTLQVTGNDGVTATQPIESADVAATTLFALRPIDEDSSLPDVHGPLQAFVGTNVIIAQSSAGSDGSPRAGHAALALDAGSTDVQSDPTCSPVGRDCFVTGTKTGVSHVSSPLGSVELDVVDDSAIASFAISDSPDQPIQVTTFQSTADLLIVPSDAAGRPIIGSGPPATVSVGDSRVLASDEDLGDLHGIHIFTTHELTTTLDVTWGSVHNTYTLQIMPFVP